MRARRAALESCAVSLVVIFQWIGAAAQIAAAVFLMVYARRSIRRREAAEVDEWKQVHAALNAELTRFTAFSMPSHCFDCGALLMGGATRHKPGCSITGLIAEHFPRAN